MNKRWLRLIAVILSTIVGILLLTSLFLLTPLPKKYAFEKLRDNLRSRSGIELSVSAFHLDFFGGEIDLEDPEIRSSTQPGLPPIFKANRIYIRIGLFEAIRGNWIVEELRLKEPQIYVFAGREGQTNLPVFSSGGGPAPNLLIIDAIAEDGSFRFQDIRRDLSVVIPQWRLSVKGSPETSVHDIVFTGSLNSGFEYKNLSVPINSLEFSGKLQGKDLQIDRIQIEGAGSRLSARGSLVDLSSPEMDLNLTPDIDLAGIASVTNLKEVLQGSITGEIQVSGGFRDTRIDAQLNGTDVSIRDFIITRLGLSTRTEWNGDSGRFSVNSLSLTSPQGSISAEAEFFAGPGEKTNSVEARIRDLNLSPVLKQFGSPFDLAGRSSGSVALQWEGAYSPSKLRGKANLNLTAPRKDPALNLLPVSGALDAQIRSNRVRVKLQPLEVFGTEVNGQFDLISFRDIEGDFHGSAPDIRDLMKQLSQFLGMPDYLVGTDMAGPIQLDVRAKGRLRQPEIVAAVHTPSLQLGGLKNLRGSAEATLRGSQVNFSNTINLPQDSTLSIRGALELGGPRTALNLDLFTDGIPIATLLSLAKRDIRVSGTLKSSLHVDGAMDRLNGYGSITGEGLSLYGEPLGQLNVDLRMTGNEIESTQFRLARNPQSPETDCLDAWFRYAVDSGQFEFRAEGKDLTLRRLKLPGTGAIRGNANLTVSGQGTTDQPSVDFRLESNNVQVQRYSVGPVSVSGALRNGQITIDTLASAIGVSSTAVVETRDPYSFDFKLLAEDSDISLLGLKGIDGQNLSGTVAGSLNGSGNFKDLARADLSANIQRLYLQTGRLEINNRGPIQAQYRDYAFALISTASLVSGNSVLEITGGLPIRKSAPSGTLRLSGRMDLDQATNLFPPLREFRAEGVLNLDLALTGTPQELSGSGAVSLNDAVIQLPQIPTPLTGVNLQADIQGSALIVQRSNASWGESRIRLTGELPFELLPESIPLKFADKKRPARFVLDVENLKPEETGLLPEEIKGLISFHLAGEAAALRPDSLSAQVDFQDLSLQVGNISFSQKRPSSIQVRDGVASISQLALSGPKTNIEASGSAGLFPDGPLDLKLTGDVDSALFTLATQNLKLDGKMTVQADIAGSRTAPALTGSAQMDGGRMSLRNPRIIADSLSVRMDFSSDRILVRKCSGTLNGGSIDLGGTIGYHGGILDDFNLEATLQDFFLNYPEGLKSASSGELEIKSSEDAIVISGDLRVLESSYREPLRVGGRVMDYLKAQQVLEIGKKHDPLLERIRLDIAIRAATPLLVQNNIAKVEAGADLRLVGTYYNPSIVGRVDLNEGGEIILNRQNYYIDRGVITLSNQAYIEPDLNIRAQARVDIYDITLQLTGTPNRLTTTLSSEPALSEPDILSLLLTGRRVSEPQRGGETQMVRTQALSLIAGQAGEEVAREARELLHLSTFRIDPGLIASESDPGARLTIGEDVTRDFSLAYSMNLVDGGDQIWIARYDVGRSLSTQATRQYDNSYRFELSHNLRFGGPSAERTSASNVTRFKIGSIQIQGEEPLTEKLVLDKLKLKAGDKFDFQKVQNGLDRLQNYYTDQNRLEANIRMHRETGQSTVNLHLDIEPGPAVEFAYEGTNIPGNVKKKVEKAWENGVFEAERLEDAIMPIRRSLIRAGFLQPEVTYDVETEGDRKLVRFQIAPGSRYRKTPIKFSGASGIGAAELSNLLNQANLGADIYADPENVADYLERYYRENGYLNAKVGIPKWQLDPATDSGNVTVDIQEGPLFLIGDLEFRGNHAFDYDQLWSVIPTSTGSSYDPDTLRDAVKALEDLYHSKGYNDATVTFRVVQDSETAQAHLTFQITERRQSVIRDIKIEGTLGTNLNFVQRQLDFKIGDVLDFRKVDATRKQLYTTGVYASVDFQNEEIPFSEPGPQEKSVRIRIRLREIQPYRLQYGIFYDTERGPGGILEAQNMNFLGRATNLGMRLRYDSDFQEVRLFYNQPFIPKIHVRMNASAFIQRENRPGFSASRIGFSIFREKNLPREFRFQYGYRFDRVAWDEYPPGPDPLPDPTLYQTKAPVGRAVFTLARDTRDSFLDATRGEFASHSLEIGPRFLGSRTAFARYYGQYFRYVPLDKYLGRPQRDAEGKRIPPRIFYAGALRLGLSGAFSGEDMISPERFYAGGGTTMRGFEQDMLGPVEVLESGMKRPLGGEGLFLFNNELRFPIVSSLQGVVFLDLGNVYRELSDFNFSLRKSAGVGLRLKIKYVPIRLDYGYKLDRRWDPRESAGAFFFSIGQAF